MSRALKNLISSIESHCCSPMSKETGKKLCVYHGWGTPSFFFVTEGYCKLMMVGTWMSPHKSMALENLARAIRNKKEHTRYMPYLSHGRSHTVYSDNSQLINTIYVEHLVEAAEMLPDDWPGHDLKIKEIYESEPAFNVVELSKQVSAALKELGVQTRSDLITDLAMGVYDNTMYTQYVKIKLIEHGNTPSPCLETLAQLPLRKIRSLCTYEKSKIYELHICKYRDGTCRLDIVNRAVVDTSWASFCLDILPVRNSQADKNKIVKEAIQYCIDAEKIYRFVDGYWYVNKEQIDACINAVLKIAGQPVRITGDKVVWIRFNAPDVSEISYPDESSLLYYNNKYANINDYYIWRFSAKELDKLISILGPQWPMESPEQSISQGSEESDDNYNEGEDSSHNDEQSESESPSHNRGPESQEKSGQASQKKSSEDNSSSSQEREDSSQEGSQNGSGGSNNNQSQNSSNKQGQNKGSTSGANKGSQQSSGENNSQSCGEDSESSDNNHSSGEGSSSAGGDESSQKGGDASADHKSASVAGDESERCSDSSSATERSPHDVSPATANAVHEDAQATEANKQGLCERGTSAQSNRDLSDQDAGDEEGISEGNVKDVSSDELDSSSGFSSDSPSSSSFSNDKDSNDKEGREDESDLPDESSESSRSEDQDAGDQIGSGTGDSQSESSDGAGNVSDSPKKTFGGDHRDEEEINRIASERQRLMICMKIAKIIDNLVDSATYGEDNPALRYDARKLVKEISCRTGNLARARKSVSSKKKVIIAPDVSGSCHKYASLMTSVAQLLWKINPERYVVMLHSNGYVVSCAMSKNNIKNYEYSEILMEDLIKDKLNTNEVALFLGIGDSDAMLSYFNIGSNIRTLLLYLEGIREDYISCTEFKKEDRYTFRLLSDDNQKIAVIDNIRNESDILAALYQCCQSTIVSKLRELPAKQ